MGDGLGALIRELTLDGQVSTLIGVPGQMGCAWPNGRTQFSFVSSPAYGDGLAIASPGAVLVIRR